MTNLVVERSSLSQVMDEWLKALGIREGDKLEIVFSPQQVIVRPESAEHAELDVWLEQATQKYDSVLRRLADS